MNLTLAAFARAVYWRWHRNPSAVPHMLGIPPNLARNLRRLRRAGVLAGGSDRLLAISLVEHMGDVAAAEPLARRARRASPGARIVWVTGEAYAPLPAAYPDVDIVLSVRCLTEWLMLRQYVRFDTVWDLHVGGRMCPLCAVPLVKTGDDVPNTEDYCRFGSLLDVHCAAAGLPALRDAPVLTPPRPAAAMVQALGLPARFIVIHARSNDRRKDWPAGKWHDLLEGIAASLALPVVEVGLKPLVIQADTAERRSLCGRLSLLETAEVIRRSALFIGIDSGPAHLANAVGTPGVVLLGAYRAFPSYTPYSGPYASGHASLLRANGPAAALDVAEVLGAVRERLELIPAALRADQYDESLSGVQPPRQPCARAQRPDVPEGSAHRATGIMPRPSS